MSIGTAWKDGEYLGEIVSFEWGSKSTKEDNMELKVQAPQNPYRAAQALDGDIQFGRPRERLSRRSDTEHGPGLTAADIDSMVREHFRDGYAAGERSMAPAVKRLEDGREGIYDEGYAAGRVERARELASSLYMALRTELLEHPLYHTAAPKMTRAQLRASADDFAEKIDAVLDELRRVVAGEHDAFILAGDEQTIVR